MQVPKVRPKIPGFVFSALTLAAFAFIAALSLSFTDSPPPTIMEFAPQAVQQIRETPNEQERALGSQDLPGGVGAPPPPPKNATAADLTAVEVPRVKRCIGDPPRQTEDPQSPPCIPYWEGENGGATSKGVTENEIIVAYPSVFLEDTVGVRLLEKYVNKRFQFYGRQIRLAEFTPTGNLYARPDPATERADAVKADEEFGAFASLSTGLRGGSEHHYYDELARRKIIGISHGSMSQSTEARNREFAPYQWHSLTGIDVMLRNYAEFVCNTLAGRPPVHAGPPIDSAPRRVFGMIYQRNTDGAVPPMDIFRDGLAKCGVTLAAEQEDAQSADTRVATTAIIKMQDADVTSVICWCDSNDVKNAIYPAATTQGYYPEWLISSYINNDVENTMRNSPPDQTVHTFGVAFRNKLLDRERMMWWLAAKEIDPNYAPGEGSGYSNSARYSSMLLLASGIQMAGPNLTPFTFERALHRTRFPNPGAGAAPYYQARVGFEGGRHTMMDDGTMIWWSADHPGWVEPSQPGAFCYMNRGARYGLGKWPKETQRFFEGPCD